MSLETYAILVSLLVCLGTLLSLGFFALMYKWAKKQKGAAMAFGMLVQMFLPDPKVEQTIEMVVESKKEVSGDREADNTSNEGDTEEWKS